MKKLLKILFALLVILAIAGVIIWLVQQKGWHWWVGVAMFSAIVGVLFAILILRRALTKRKMREFVSRVVDQNNFTTGVGVESANRIQTLKNRWQEALNIIKVSKANDIPWFVMLGGNDSGKTAAVRNAKLNVSLSSTIRSNQLTKTEGCEWWFLEKSIIVDTTSRYITPEDEFNDAEEWKELLNLFLKHRRRKSISGVVVTISAERLLSADAMSLREEGQNLRKRIDNLMRILWTKFPVYIMITKVDKVFGFNELFQNLSKNQVNQVAGFVNNNEASWSNVVDNFFTATADNLDRLREQVISNVADVDEAGLLLFPLEFAKLYAPFYEFVQPIFENNSYQEQPLCRGIYFSSAEQDGNSTSHILKYAGNFVQNNSGYTAHQGIFLRDFFEKVLPTDRWYFKPAYNIQRLRYFIGSIGFLAILSVMIAIGSLMTASYEHNQNIINLYKNEAKSFPTLNNDISNNMIYFYDVQKAIHKLEARNNHWGWIPSFGLTTAQDFTEHLKEQYVNLYRQHFLNDFNNKIYDRMLKVNENTDSQEASLYIAFLTARIDSVNARLSKTAYDTNVTNSDMNLQNVFPSIILTVYPQVPLNVANSMEETYISFIAWSHDQESIKRNMKAMLQTLRDLLMKNPVSNVIKHQQAFIPFNIKLSDFWGDLNGHENENVIVPGMFTKEGLVQIKKFLALVKDAGVIQGENDPILQQFWEWYQSEYYSSWHKFILAFNQVDALSFNDDERKSLVFSMTTESNPYTKLINTAAYQLEPEEHISNIPDWASLILELNNLNKMSSEESNIITLRKTVLQNIGKIVSNERVDQKSEFYNTQVKNSAILKDYYDSLAQVTPDLVSDDSYLRYVGNIFAEYNGKADVKSPVSIAVIKFGQLQHAMSANNQNDMVWKVIAGPLNFMLQYLLEKTSCAIENKWDSDVIGRIMSVKSSDIPKALLENNRGLLWQFLNDTATPFLAADRWGYSPKYLFDKTYFGQEIDFNSEFFTFINSSRPSMVDLQSQYPVSFATVPVTVSPDANVKPYGTVLTVQCADGEQTLKNYNYPNQATINWSPDKCGDTSISILFSNFTLTKTYPGNLGFVRFLVDFRSGSHRFNNSDFVESSMLQNEYKINWIQVKYNINHNIPTDEMLKSVNTHIPQNITNCGGTSNDYLDSFLNR